MTPERRDAANLALVGIMVAAWLGYLGYTLWRDYEARSQTRQIRAMLDRRQEELWERWNDTRPQPDIVITPEPAEPAPVSQGDRSHS